MRLHNQTSYIHKAKAQKPKKRLIPRITQWIYFLFLLFIAVYVIYFFINRTFTFNVNGIIEVEKSVVRAKYTGLFEPEVTVGDEVIKGQSLGVIKSLKSCASLTENKEIQRYELAVEKSQIELEQLRSELSVLNDFIAKASNKSNMVRALELSAPLVTSNNGVDQKLSRDALILRSEISAKQSEVEALNRALEREKRRPLNPLPAECFDQKILSNADGIIVSQSLSSSQLVKFGDPMYSIIPPGTQTVVRFYLDYEQRGNLAVGDSVTIIAPDLSESDGIVTVIQSAALQDNDLVRKEYNPVLPTLMVEVKSEDAATEHRWSKFDRQVVEVKGYK